jgi:hypothetical protein
MITANLHTGLLFAVLSLNQINHGVTLVGGVNIQYAAPTTNFTAHGLPNFYGEGHRPDRSSSSASLCSLIS